MCLYIYDNVLSSNSLVTWGTSVMIDQDTKCLRRFDVAMFLFYLIVVLIFWYRSLFSTVAKVFESEFL